MFSSINKKKLTILIENRLIYVQASYKDVCQIFYSCLKAISALGIHTRNGMELLNKLEQARG